MHCCEKCFKDPEIKAIICGNNKRGKCDFCHRENVYICELENEDNLRANFESLFNIYTPIDEIGYDYPKEKADLLKNILCSQWSIFHLDPDSVYKFLITLLPERYSEQPELFDKPVGISGSMDESYLKKYSMLGIYQWEDFVEEIKKENRFHTNIINKDILKNILGAICKRYKAGQKFYRARIWETKYRYEKDAMGAPPAGKASAGRANSEGISRLYLANSIDTTLHETRARVNDYATVATFQLLEDIEVVDLATIDKISPFKGIDSSLLAINLPHLRKIGYEISKPLRRHDSPLDYLPTQYISDYIKSIGFSGIEYKSTMCKNGINFAFFDEMLFECIATENYDIDSLTYGYSALE